MNTLLSSLARYGCAAAGLALMLAAMAGQANAGSGPPPSIPEIDPGSVLSAVTLLSGGLMILTDRRRAK